MGNITEPLGKHKTTNERSTDSMSMSSRPIRAQLHKSDNPVLEQDDRSRPGTASIVRDTAPPTLDQTETVRPQNTMDHGVLN